MRSRYYLATTLFVASSASLTSFQVIAQQCPQLESAVVEVFGPSTEVDTINVTLSHGSPQRWMFAFLDAGGRAILMRDSRYPEETKIGSLNPNVFSKMLTEAREVVEADANRTFPERKPMETSTLEGLLEAIEEGSRLRECQPDADGFERNLEIHIDGQVTYHRCVIGELARFTEVFWGSVAQAVEASGEYLCE